MRLVMPLALVATLTASVCAGQTPDRRATSDLPSTYRQAKLSPRGEPLKSAEAALRGYPWWSQFKDPVLDQLIADALGGSLDIETARARLQQASGGLRAARSALAPALSIAGNGAQKRQSLNDPMAQLASATPGFERTQDQFGLSVAASWEIDLFGRLNAGRRAARADTAAATAGLAATRLTVAAEVANAYFDARELQRHLGIARARTQARADLRQLVDLRAREGEASQPEAEQARASLLVAQASVAVLEAALDAAYDRLDVLCGRPPGRASAALGEGDLPAQPPRLDADIAPAALLRRRPDLVAAERQAVAADARVKQTIADAYAPKLTISALLGAIAPESSSLFTGSAALSAGSAAFAGRLLDFGAARGQVEVAKGRAREANAQYRLAVLRALQEVEGALSSQARGAVQADQLASGVSSLTRTRDLARLAYQDGALSLIEALEAEQRLLDMQDAEATARAESARSAVMLFKALGGGWTLRAQRP